MGVCQSTPKTVKPLTENDLVVLLVRGTDLRQADIGMGLDTSDPYAMLRVGTIGSNFHDKDEDMDRVSGIVMDSLNPEWNFACRFTLPEGVDRTKLELHIVCQDKDIFTSDDPLGEVRIPLTELDEAEAKSKATTIKKPLTGKRAQGSIELMVGEAVDRTFIDRLEARMDNDGGATSWLAAYSQYWSRDVEDVQYYKTMIHFLLAGRSGVGGLSKWMLRKGGESRQWEGPFRNNCRTFMAHEDVRNHMANLGQRLGTDNLNGEVYRENFLGFQFLNDQMWPELKGVDAGIGLSSKQEAHALVRPLLDTMVGPKSTRWSREEIAARAADFFKDRTEIKVGWDFKLWKIHVGIDLTWEEADSFMKMQGKLLIGIGVPPGAVKSKPVRSLLGLDQALKEKATWLQRIKTALPKEFPETGKYDDATLTRLASNVMDSLLFAGGQSVQTVLTYCIALPYSEWGIENLPKDAIILTEENLWVYAMETMRVFAPVSGFSFREKLPTATVRQPDGKPCTSDPRVFCFIDGANTDPKAWGEDCNEFVMRPVEQYHKFGLTWADAAIVDGDNAHPNSHVCPAKDLSINLIVEFMRAYMRATIGETESKEGKNMEYSRWKASLTPDKITVNGYGVKSFVLTKNEPPI